jgi:hypothetical protein
MSALTGRILMRLGEVLVEQGLATRLQVDMALALQRQRGGLVGAILVATGAISREQLVAVLEAQRQAAEA